MAGAATAAIFAVDYVTDVVVAVFNEPVGTDDFAKSFGIGCVCGQAGDVIRPRAWCFGRGGAHSFDAEDLGCPWEGFEPSDPGGGAQVYTANDALFVSSMLMIVPSDFGGGSGCPVEPLGLFQ